MRRKNSTRLGAPHFGRMGGRSPVRVAFDSHAVVGMWAIVASAYTYIFGENAKGNKTVTAIDVESNGCMAPANLKVDRAENLWLACGTSPSDAGVIQAYASGSKKPLATFADSFTCGEGLNFDANANDVATDSSGHVFAANPFSETCDPSCTDWTYPLVWWNAKLRQLTGHGHSRARHDERRLHRRRSFGETFTSKATAASIASAARCSTRLPPDDRFCKDYALYRTVRSGSSVGAVYVSNKGRVLNIVDSGSRTMLQYALPWVSRESPFNVLGPTPTNYDGGRLSHRRWLRPRRQARGTGGRLRLARRRQRCQESLVRGHECQPFHGRLRCRLRAVGQVI